MSTYVGTAPNTSRHVNGGTPLRQILQGSAWNGLAIAASRLAPSFLTIVLAWWLEPAELGTLSFVLAYYSVLSLFADWSIAYSVQKLIPENVELTPEIAWTGLFLRLGSSTVLGLLCWLIDSSTHVFRGYGMHLALLLITSSFGIIVCVQNARCNFAVSSSLNVAFQAAWIGIAIILVKSGLRITGPLLALAASYTFLGIPAFLFSSGLLRRVRFVRPAALGMIRFGLWATIAAAFGGIATQSGLLVLAYRTGDSSAGIFRVAMTFGMLPALLGMMVLTPLMPVVKRGLLQGTDISGSLILPIIRFLLILGLPIAITAGVLAPAIIDTFARSSYLGAVWPMRYCLAANIFVMLITALSGILFVGEGLRALARVQAIVALILILNSVVLARAAGPTGVAIVSLGAWSVGAVLLYRWLHNRTQIRLEWSSYLRYAGSACISGAIVLLTIRQVHSSLHRCLVGGCLAGCVYATLLWLQRDPDFLRIRKLLRESRLVERPSVVEVIS